MCIYVCAHLVSYYILFFDDELEENTVCKRDKSKYLNENTYSKGNGSALQTN